MAHPTKADEYSEVPMNTQRSRNMRRGLENPCKTRRDRWRAAGSTQRRFGGLWKIWTAWGGGLHERQKRTS